tara:strand:+ start:2618 stop:3172 length:555 start_codon:yes stop_codon:yes gene_type:complete
MTATVAIYALTDPRTGADRYIGKANDAARRFKGHLRDARRRDTPVYRWIRKLDREGLIPGMRMVAKCEPQNWQRLEALLIEQARRRGAALLNVAAGGDEPFCPTEVRAANGRANARTIHSDPIRKAAWTLKRNVGEALKDGLISNKSRAALRQLANDPCDLFASFASIPDRSEDPDGRPLNPVV